MTDSELFYVRQASRVQGSSVYLVARRGDAWYSRIMDCMGLSPIQVHSGRPNMTGFKPYILCQSWDEVAPLVGRYRRHFADRLMVECGFESPHEPWECENDFLEAVRTPDGGVAVSASHRPKLSSRRVQTLISINAVTGENEHRNTFYDDDEEFQWQFKRELERIPKEEAEKAIRKEIEAWWDAKIEQCAQWRDARWRKISWRNCASSSAV